jgi:hypothetical protein
VTKLATRIDEIEKIEGFRIVLKKLDGTIISNDQAGYPLYGEHKKKLKGTATVQEWKKNRFAPVYAGHGVTCDVLYSDGTVAVGQTSLSVVRDTYPKIHTKSP